MLDNATARLVSAVPAWTRTLVLDFRVTAMSDERREGMCRLALNLATGAMPEWQLDSMGLLPDQEDLGALPADLPGKATRPSRRIGKRLGSLSGCGVRCLGGSRLN